MIYPKATKRAVSIAKYLQLITSVIAFLCLISPPGIMVLIGIAIGLCYLFSAICAMDNNRLAIWLAFICTATVATLSWLGIYRFLSIGFDFFAGSFNIVPYTLLLIALSSTAAIVLHLISWRWMVSGRVEEQE